MLEALIAWLPFVLIIGVFLWFSVSQMRSYKKHVDRVQTINDEILEINQAMIAELREIKEILKDHK